MNARNSSRFSDPTIHSEVLRLCNTLGRERDTIPAPPMSDVEVDVSTANRGRTGESISDTIPAPAPSSDDVAPATIPSARIPTLS